MTTSSISILPFYGIGQKSDRMTVMRRFPSVSMPVLIVVLAVVALGAGFGIRAWREMVAASDTGAFLALNPECRLPSQCMALDCGGQTFVVPSDVTFDVVQQVRATWCGGGEVTGRQTGVRCGSYGRCVLGDEGAGGTSAANLASVTDLGITSVFVYPNVRSAFFSWQTSVPADARVVVSAPGRTEVSVASESGRAIDHRAAVYGLESDTEYTYRIEASFQRSIAAQATGVFRVLAAPGEAN
jgi:hypothetical protein